MNPYIQRPQQTPNRIDSNKFTSRNLLIRLSKAKFVGRKIDSQWEFAEWVRKLKQELCINLEVWDGEGASKGRGYMYTYG